MILATEASGSSAFALKLPIVPTPSIATVPPPCEGQGSDGGAPGMTARLTVNYRKPTPWGMPLRFEGRIERREGRKVFTTGTCYAGDLLTAEAEALFISVDFTRLAELAADRQRRAEAR